jgi:hypothetical protein
LEQRFAAAAMAPSGSVRSSSGVAAVTRSTVRGDRGIREDLMGDAGHRRRL